VAGFRRCLPSLIAGWLVLQLCTSVAAGAILQAASVSADDAVCQCPGTTPGQKCPMHRSHGSQHDDSDEKRCSMRNAGLSDVALFSCLASGAVPVVQAAVIAPDLTTPVSAVDLHVTSRSVLPDAPPPRA